MFPAAAAAEIPQGSIYAVTLTGPCKLDDSGLCGQSPNYPANYNNAQSCHIENVPAVPLQVVAFDTEYGFEHYAERLTCIGLPEGFAHAASARDARVLGSPLGS